MLGKTAYEVGIRYTLDDKAARGLTSMGNAADGAGKNIAKLKGLLAGVGVGLAGAFYVGKKYLVDYNSQIDQMRIGLTTVIQSQLHKPFAQARKEADGLFLRMQEVAKKSPATTKDFIEMANAIAPAVAQLGGGVGKIESLSTGAVIAAQAYGFQADVAGRDISQMLRGDVTDRDQLAKLLLGSRGIDKDKFNAMSGSERGRITEEVLNDKSLKDAADRFGDSFQGQLSSLQDQLQITLGEVGKPLVSAITAEFKKWNQWISKNPGIIADWAKTFGRALVDGFQAVKKAVGWIVDNRETIMMIAKVFAAFKIGQLAGGVVGDVIGGLGKLGSSLSGATSAIGLFAGAAMALATWVDDVQSKEIKNKTDMVTVREYTEKLYGSGDQYDDNLRHLGRNARADKFIRPDGTVDVNKLVQMNGARNSADVERGMTGVTEAGFWQTINKTQMSKEEAERMIATGSFRGMDYGRTSQDSEAVVIRQIAALTLAAAETQQEAAKRQLEAASLAMFNGDMFQNMLGIFGMSNKNIADQLEGGWKEGAKTGDMNVTINKIEVASEDPDRFVFGMNRAFERAAQNRTQAKNAIAEGL